MNNPERTAAVEFERWLYLRGLELLVSEIDQRFMTVEPIQPRLASAVRLFGERHPELSSQTLAYLLKKRLIREQWLEMLQVKRSHEEQRMLAEFESILSGMSDVKTTGPWNRSRSKETALEMIGLDLGERVILPVSADVLCFEQKSGPIAVRTLCDFGARSAKIAYDQSVITVQDRRMLNGLPLSWLSILGLSGATTWWSVDDSNCTDVIRSLVRTAVMSRDVAFEAGKHSVEKRQP